MSSLGRTDTSITMTPPSPSASLRNGPIRAEASQPTDNNNNRKSSSHAPAVRHAPSAISVLKAWLSANSPWPYPTQQDKEALSLETGMTVRQISQWFVNARRRNGGKTASSEASSSSLSKTTTISAAIRSAASQSAPAGSDFDQWHDMTPLERWRHSPPEDEPAPLHAISWASENSTPLGPGDSSTREGITIPPPTGPSQLGAISAGSSDTSSAVSSTYSHSSGLSSDNFSAHFSALHRQSRSRRKSRKRAARGRDGERHHASSHKDTETESRPYQCTFCTDTFKTRYDWTRHEATLHLVLEKWTCLPFGLRNVEPGNEGAATCALCGAADPSEAHAASHNAAECAAKPAHARTFFRKDHLRQHVRVAHGAHKMLPSMAAWRTKMTRVRSRCGFCGRDFASWPERNGHIANHFRDGALMKDWRGCRGLDSAVALLVENAIPPYLIGAEAADPEPFSALRGASKKMSPADATRPPPTAFESLTERLGGYVQAASWGNGAAVTTAAVTDDDLRRQARLILYDDEDPWNQTPADNDQWLRMFKLGYGLGGDAGVDRCQAADAFLPPPTDETLPFFLDDDLPSVTPRLEISYTSTPFTADMLAQAAGGDGTALPLLLGVGAQDPVTGPGVEGTDDMLVPWPWQTPECLAGFRQMGQAGSPECEVSGVQGDDLDLFLADTAIGDPGADSATGASIMKEGAGMDPIDNSSDGMLLSNDFMLEDLKLSFEPHLDPLW